MPNYVNPHRVHSAIANRIMNDDWTRAGDISVTQVIKPPLALYLEALHDHEITVDVGERIFPLLGQILHLLLEDEAGKLPNALPEEALTLEVAGWTVSGRPDLWQAYDEVTDRRNVITDWKMPMTGAMTRSDVRGDWVLQLNFYRLLYLAAGFEVDHMEVVAILKDWNKRRARESSEYPQAAFIRRVVPVLPDAEAILLERVEAHQRARAGKPRWCNTEERWARPDAYAVMRGKQKKATAVFGEGKSRGGGRAEALELIEAHKADGNGLRLEVREGDKYVRCRDYCDAAPYCPLLKQEGITVN